MPTLTTPTVQQQAEAIASTLTNAGIRSAAFLPDTFTPPIAVVGIEEIDYHTTFGGVTMSTFAVLLIVPRPSDRAGVEALEAYMSNTGTQSVRSILETDQTLGGVVETCFVAKAGRLFSVTIGQSGSVYTVCPFEVQVHA